MKILALLFFLISILFRTSLAQVPDFTSINFNKADSIAELYPNHSLSNIKLLTDKLTKPLSTEEEKFRAIYKWICNNIENDYSLHEKNMRMRSKLKDNESLKAWNKKASKTTFKNLLDKHKTVCTGYAYLLKEMASCAGLTCKIIDGYGRTVLANIGGTGKVNHSWNAIQLNNKWYLCDATWSSGYYDVRQAIYTKKFDASYFLADPNLFVRNHYPLDTAWFFLKDKPTLREFLDRPIIYSNIYQYQITKLFPETFSITTTKGTTVSFQFTKNEKKVDGVELQIGNYKIHPQVNQEQLGVYTINHTFSSKGTYIVHFLFDGKYVFTYRVKVEK